MGNISQSPAMGNLQDFLCAGEMLLHWFSLQVLARIGAETSSGFSVANLITGFPPRRSRKIGAAVLLFSAEKQPPLSVSGEKSEIFLICFLSWWYSR
jgi:hypothetical protein